MSGRLQTGLITFLPPLAFALFYPRGFVMALGYAGVALAVLALLIPAMLVWQCRKQIPQAGYRVAGGTPALALVFICGIIVIGVQFSIALGFLPDRANAVQRLPGPDTVRLDNHHAMAVYEPLMQAALLKFLPLPHGQGSLRPTFTSAFIGICSGVVCGCAIHRA